MLKTFINEIFLDDFIFYGIGYKINERIFSTKSVEYTSVTSIK
jgi:hypothetical protein